MGFFDQFGNDYKAAMSNSYANAEVQNRGGSLYITLPDGDYQPRVYSVSFDEAQNADSVIPAYFVITFEMTEGEYKGKRFSKRYPLTPDVNFMQTLKTDLKTLGIVLPNDDFCMIEKEEVISPAIDQIVDVRIRNRKAKNGKTYMNIYLNRAVGTYTDTPFGAATQADDDPFAGFGGFGR
jgi:hypothetical protein